MGNVTRVHITADKQVQCVEEYYQRSYSPRGSYTKCIRLGSGWPSVNAAVSFAINNNTVFDQSQESSDDIFTNIYLSDKATYFNDTTDFGSGLLSCSRSSYSDCDWDAVFSTRLPFNFDMVAKTSLVTEISRPNKNFPIWLDATSYLSFVDYQLSFAPSSNDYPFVTTFNTSVPVAGADSLIINLDWLLAAWSTKDNGIINGTSALGLKISSLFEDIDNVNVISLIYYFTIMQALTLVPYDSSNINSIGSLPNENPENIYLHYWRSRRVWMDSLSSRSAKLGAVIICISMVVVISRTVLAIYQKLLYNHVTRAHSLTEIIAACLAHHSEGEFDHLEGKSAYAQVRFRIDDDEAAKFLQFKVQKTKTL